MALSPVERGANELNASASTRCTFSGAGFYRAACLRSSFGGLVIFEQQAAFARGDHRLQSAADPERSQDAADVRLDRAGRDVEAPADELVRQPLAEQREHVALPRREMDLAPAGPTRVACNERQARGCEIRGCLR